MSRNRRHISEAVQLRRGSLETAGVPCRGGCRMSLPDRSRACRFGRVDCHAAGPSRLGVKSVTTEPRVIRTAQRSGLDPGHGAPQQVRDPKRPVSEGTALRTSAEGDRLLGLVRLGVDPDHRTCHVGDPHPAVAGRYRNGLALEGDRLA